MHFTIPITSVQYIYLRHCLSKVYSTRNSVFFALKYCYVKCCKICQNKKNGISQFLDKPNVSIAYKEKKKKWMQHLFVFLNKLCNTNLSNARKSEEQHASL